MIETPEQEVESPQKIEERNLYDLANQLAGLMKQFPDTDIKSGLVGKLLLETDQIQLEHIGRIYSLIDKKHPIKGVGEGLVAFDVDEVFPGSTELLILHLAIHTDKQTQEEVERLLQKNPFPPIKPLIRTKYIFTENGIYKTAWLPKPTADKRPNVLYGMDYMGFKDVESPIEDNEYEMIGFILTRFSNELKSSLAGETASL